MDHGKPKSVFDRIPDWCRKSAWDYLGALVAIGVVGVIVLLFNLPIPHSSGALTDYDRLAQQYSSFLVAISGVCMTVLAIVLATGRIQTTVQSRLAKVESGLADVENRLPKRPKETPDIAKDANTKKTQASETDGKGGDNRTPLIGSLIIATFCSFVGSQLMAETTAFLSSFADRLDFDKRLGAGPFFFASVNIFNGCTLVIFALMWLTFAYKKEDQTAVGIRKMSLSVFCFVVFCVIWWMVLSVVARMPVPQHLWWSYVSCGLALVLLGSINLIRRRVLKKNEYLLPLVFVAILILTVASLVLFSLSLATDKDGLPNYVPNYRTVAFFVFSITFTCVALIYSGVLFLKDERVWPCEEPSEPQAELPICENVSSPQSSATPPLVSTNTVTTSRMKAPKILILSSDTGGGHRSAAAAIVAGVQKFLDGESYAVRVVKAVEESHAITAKMVGTYNWVLRNRQHWMKYLYWAMNRFRPETREFFHRRCIGYVRTIFERWCPHVVVSVHPLTQHIFGRVLKELKLADRIPLVSVVTDPYYGFWKGWACNDVTLYLVASDEARRQLIDYGIAPERIKVSGMPVHHKFAYPGEEAAQVARQALGLDPEKFTVFVNAGWEGGGNIPQIFRELVRGELNVQAIFLAGRNEELRADAESLAESASFPVKVIGYSEHVEQLMGAANVMISKLGGLTTFEAFACRLPIIADAITAPMPQEAGTASLLVRRGAGVLLQRAGDIVPVIRRMVEDTSHYSAMRAATIGLAIPNATRYIVEEIAALIPASTDAPEGAVPAEVAAA